MDNTQFENHISVGGPYNRFDFERRYRYLREEWGIENMFVRFPKHFREEVDKIWLGHPEACSYACCTDNTVEIIIICNEGNNLSQLYQVFTVEKT